MHMHQKIAIVASHGKGSAVHLKEPVEVGATIPRNSLGFADPCEEEFMSSGSNALLQCGTSRRYKTSLSAALEPPDERGRQGPDPMPFMTKEEEVMAYQDDSELQLSQIFTGARKLNQMIGSWSTAPNLDGPWKYFAEDLLRSALHLQESLIMLEKLQNASSKLMFRMNRKQKPEFLYQKERELEQENHFDALGSKRFAGGSYHNRLQKPLLSADRSSWNLVEELQRVIGDSLYRQNLLSLSSEDEKASSRKLLRCTQNKGSRNKPSGHKVELAGSILASDQPKKLKAPNLIAKLMGLEEVPSGTVQPIKKEEKGKCINSPRHSLDNEMPKSRKLGFVQQIPDTKRETLHKIIETKQFKGLSKNSQVEDHRFQLHFFDTPLLQQYARDFYRDDDVPPNMIVKSPHLPCYERGKVPKELTFEKVMVKGERRTTKLVQEEKVSDRTNMVTKLLERKEVKTRGKTKEKSSPKVKAIASSCQKQQKKEAFKAHKKPKEEQKPLMLDKQKLKEKKNDKASNVSVSHLTTSTAVSKPDKRLSAARNIASTQISTSQNQNLKCSSKSVDQKFSDSTKEKKISGAKPVKRSNIVKTSDDNKRKEDGKEFNSHNKMDSVSIRSCRLSGDELPEQVDQDAQPCSSDDTIKTQNALCEVMRKTNQVERISELGEAVIQLPENKATKGEATGIEDDLKLLLLSSQSFLYHAQELFTVDAISPVCYQSKGKDEVGKRNAKLLLDIAEELMVCKCHRLKHSIHSSVQTNLSGRMVYHSLDQLVEEISNEISELRNYSITDDDATAADVLYIKLERDLKCKDAMQNAMWDFGWVNWICMEDTDQIVGEVGEHILACLIEEAATELVY